MAMSVAGLAAAIEAAITIPITSKAQFASALATAIVPYIKSNAVVPALGLSSPAGAVTGATTVT